MKRLMLLTAFTSALIAAQIQDAVAKKMKATPSLGGCWTQDQISKTSGDRKIVGEFMICFGKNGRFISTIYSEAHKEAFQAEGQYRGTPATVEILGFPGEGWIGKEHFAKCTSSFDASAETMNLTECGLKGEWQRKCRTVSTDLTCGS